MAKAKNTEISIEALKVGRLRAHLVGTTAFIMHRFSRKAQEELLFPKGRANRAERDQNLKHDPVAEFRECMYRNRDEGEPTKLHVPQGMFQKAIADAALDIPGATKSQITRLTKVVTPQINLYGVPKLFMSMVRSSDIAKTPDIRTRPIFPRWACTVEIQYISNLTKANQISNLLGAAGLIVGVGDWRSQKGGPYGSFRIAEEDDPELLDIMATEGRDAQQAAWASPVAYDLDSEELLAWFLVEAAKREKHIPSTGVVEVKLEGGEERYLGRGAIEGAFAASETVDAE
jgi:hypothetical protein